MPTHESSNIYVHKDDIVNIEEDLSNSELR